MIQVKIIKPHRGYSVGEVVTVTQNVAHGLVAIRVAEIHTGEGVAEDYTDKMMRPEMVERPKKRVYNRRSYKIK